MDLSRDVHRIFHFMLLLPPLLLDDDASLNSNAQRINEYTIVQRQKQQSLWQRTFFLSFFSNGLSILDRSNSFESSKISFARKAFLKVFFYDLKVVRFRVNLEHWA